MATPSQRVPRTPEQVWQSYMQLASSLSTLCDHFLVPKEALEWAFKMLRELRLRTPAVALITPSDVAFTIGALERLLDAPSCPNDVRVHAATLLALHFELVARSNTL